MKKKLIVLLGALSLTPIVSFAQTTPAAGCNAISTFQDMLCKIAEILNFVIPVLVVLGVVYFVWGVVSYVIASDEEAKKKGRDRMIYGIIGFAVIVGVWGLVKILGTTFGIESGNTNNKGPELPGLNVTPTNTTP